MGNPDTSSNVFNNLLGCKVEIQEVNEEFFKKCREEVLEQGQKLNEIEKEKIIKEVQPTIPTAASNSISATAGVGAGLGLFPLLAKLIAKFK